MDKKIYFILLLLSTLYLYGQVDLVAEVEDKDIKVNETFKVNFILQINGNEYIQESKLRLPDLSKFNLIGSASTQNTYVNPRTNELVNQIIYQCILEPKKSGKNRIGSALVQINGKMMKTEPIDIMVGDAPKKQPALNNDLASVGSNLYLNMEIKNREVYPNQPTLAILKAYSKSFDVYRQIGNIVFPKQHNAQFAMVDAGRHDIEPLNRNEYSSQIIGIFLIYPTTSGNVEIEPIVTGLKHKEIKLLSNKINLTVNHLPPHQPEGFTNAVGKFNLSITSDTLQAEVNSPIQVSVKIKGKETLTISIFLKLLRKTILRYIHQK